MTVYDSASDLSFDEGCRAARTLSKALRTSAVHLALFDSARVRYALFDGGKRVDDFDSRPERASAGRGNVDVLIRYCVPSTTKKRLRELLTRRSEKSAVGEEYVRGFARGLTATLPGKKTGRELDILLGHLAAGTTKSKLKKVLAAAMNDPVGTEEDRLKGLAGALGIAPTRALSNHLQVVARGTRGTASVESEEAELESRLHSAARTGNLPALRKLLDRGLDIDRPDLAGRTPLDAATDGGHLRAIRLIVERGASPRTLASALRGAIVLQNQAAVRFLIAHGADVNAVDESGRSPLFCAVFHPRANVDLVARILAAGARINEPLHVTFMAGRGPRRTALHHAASVAPVDVVELLLVHGADVSSRDQLGKTPLMVAAELGRAEVVALLRRAGANRQPRRARRK